MFDRLLNIAKTIMILSASILYLVMVKESFVSGSKVTLVVPGTNCGIDALFRVRGGSDRTQPCTVLEEEATEPDPRNENKMITGDNKASLRYVSYCWD